MRLLPVSALLITACGEPPPATEAEAPEPIRVVGAENLVSRLVPALVESYRKGHPEAEFTIEPTGTALGFRSLVDGEADLVASARPASPSEEEQAKVLGFTFDGPQSRHIVAVDVVGVAVHARNPIEALSYDQVISAFCSNEVASWSVFGGPDRPIHLMVPDLESGARALSEDFFCGTRGIHPKIPVHSNQEIAQALGSDEDVLTLVSLADGAGKLLALAPDQGLPPVRPTLDNVTRGSYPLYGDLYLMTRGLPTGALGDFLKWVGEPAGQEIVDEQRFAPLFLRPERMEEARPLRETVHFEAGDPRPDSRSMARLNLLVQEIRERGVRHIVLEGYTDGQEPDPYALSEQRAQAVRELIAAEVPELYFEIIPRGPKAPIAPNDTPMGRLINRRVQVYLGEDEAAEPVGPTERATDPAAPAAPTEAGGATPAPASATPPPEG
jgi:phosphate transport system substrate-binding protein